ncbi:hypothetical protein [Aestuariibacter salexigens]|uniref:hypothetical protein n=1 Tax=Aestuariibacter salexigens TaxID=226010 RepID=UPI000427FB18|nr:hypothetical protein [Aestuariibacter salexigens]
MKKPIVFLIAIVIAVMLVWIVAMPKVIYYGSDEVSTSSIYYTGLDGKGHLMGANESFARIDETTNRLHLCLEAGLKENCQVYSISRQEGLIGVIKKMVTG